MPKIQTKDYDSDDDDLVLKAINEPDVLAAVHYRQLKAETKAAKRKLRRIRRQTRRNRFKR